MLDSVEDCIDAVEDTDIYHAALGRLRRGDFPSADSIDRLIDVLRKMDSDIDFPQGKSAFEPKAKHKMKNTITTDDG